jgi:hypothetical protein
MDEVSSNMPPNWTEGEVLPDPPAPKRPLPKPPDFEKANKKEKKKKNKKYESYFFTAAPWKLALLSVCTWGYYDFYRFYRNWVLYKKHSGRWIMPGMRATFYPLWAYSMFRKIEEKAIEHNIEFQWQAGLLALAYLVIFLFWFARDPFSQISTFTFVPLLIVNRTATAINSAVTPDYRENDRLSPLNWAAVLMGGPYVAYSLYGMIFGLPQANIGAMDSLRQLQQLQEQLNNMQ